MAWTNKQQIATTITVATDTFVEAVAGSDFSSAVVLQPGEQSVVQVEYDPPVTPTDDLVVAVQTTLDDSSENWDDEPYISFVVPNSPDPCARTFIVAGVYKWRLVFYMTGATDTTGTVNAWERRDGVSA